MLSIIPEELTKVWKWSAQCKKNKNLPRITYFIDLKEQAEVKADNGDFWFSNFHVNTSGDGIVYEDEE